MLKAGDRSQIVRHRPHTGRAYFLYSSVFGRFPPAPNGYGLDPFEHPDDSVPDGTYQVRYQTSITMGQPVGALVGGAPPPTVNVTSGHGSAITTNAEPSRNERALDVEQVLLESPQHREHLTDHRKYQMLNDIEAGRQARVRNERVNGELGHGFHLNQLYRQELTQMAQALSRQSVNTNQASIENVETALVLAKRAQELALSMPNDNTPHYLRAGVELLTLLIAGRGKGDGTTDALFELFANDTKAKKEEADIQAQLAKAQKELAELKEEKARLDKHAEDQRKARRAKEESEQAQRLKEERERLERQAAEHERLQLEHAETQRLERARAQKERLERARERFEKELAEAARIEREAAEEAQAERERAAENERLETLRAAETVRAEQERADRERLARDQAERDLPERAPAGGERKRPGGSRTRKTTAALREVTAAEPDQALNGSPPMKSVKRRRAQPSTKAEAAKPARQPKAPRKRT